MKSSESLRRHLDDLKDLSQAINAVEMNGLISKAEQHEKILQRFKRIIENMLSKQIDRKSSINCLMSFKQEKRSHSFQTCKISFCRLKKTTKELYPLAV